MNDCAGWLRRQLLVPELGWSGVEEQPQHSLRTVRSVSRLTSDLSDGSDHGRGPWTRYSGTNASVIANCCGCSGRAG